MSLLLLPVLLLPAQSAMAQRIMLKSNALYWATGTANFGAEFRLSRHYTLNFEAGYNPLSFSELSLQHISFVPEARYWFNARPQSGHFVGLMALAGSYNVTFDGTNHKGDGVGAGLTYGYAFVLGRRWSLEATVGAGLLHLNDKKHPTDAVNADEFAKHTLPCLLKAGLTFVYILK